MKYLAAANDAHCVADSAAEIPATVDRGGHAFDSAVKDTTA